MLHTAFLHWSQNQLCPHHLYICSQAIDPPGAGEANKTKGMLNKFDKVLEARSRTAANWEVEARTKLPFLTCQNLPFLIHRSSPSLKVEPWISVTLLALALHRYHRSWSFGWASSSGKSQGLSYPFLLRDLQRASLALAHLDISWHILNHLDTMWTPTLSEFYVTQQAFPPNHN